MKPFLSALFLFIFSAGCAQYVTPGRAARMQHFGVSADIAEHVDASVETSLAKRPMAQFPTGIAVARVQAPGYRSYTAQSYGDGNYSVVTTRDVEKDEQIDRLSKLPMVSGIAPLNRLLIPQQLQSDLQLRQAAGKLHADVLLIYTIDTSFFTEDKMAPLTVVTLGLSPNKQARVISTISAVLMDTRNGYIYGVAEATEKQTQLASAWTSQTAVDETRRRTEEKAFESLVGELEQTWTRIVSEYGPSAGPATSHSQSAEDMPTARNDSHRSASVNEFDKEIESQINAD